MKRILIALALIITVSLPCLGADTAMNSLTDNSGSVADTHYLVGYSNTTAYRYTISSILALKTSITGNAGTATALAANGANCSSGQAPLGVDASGAAESCFAVLASTVLDDTKGNGDTAFVWSADKVYDQLALKQTADTDLTTWAGITPSANLQTFLSTPNAANFETAIGAGAFASDLLGYANAGAVLSGIGAQANLSLVAGTYTNGNLCTYTTVGTALNCNTPVPSAATYHVDDILTALGIASEATHFGTFTGSTIADNQTAKAAIQALETAVEAKVSSSSAASYTEPGSNIPLCRTGSGTIGGCTNVTDVAFSSYAPLANPQFTGVVDIAANATTDAEGEMTIDTTTNQLRYYGGAQRVLSPIQSASFVITAPADTDDINIMKAPYGMTILGIDCIVQGTTSATGQLQECTSAGASCADLDSDITCDADGAADDGTLTDSAIASGAWIRWKTTSLSGTPTFLTVTFRYLVVAD